VFLGIFPVIPKAQLRAENKSFVFSILSFISFLFQIGLAIVFVAILHMKVEGVLAARVGAATASAFLFIFVIRKRLMFRFSLKKIKDMLSYSVYLVPVSIGSLILIMSNRYFILLFRGSEELGIFSVGNKIASVVLLGVTAFQLAWPSIMFRLKKLPNAKVYYSKVFTYYILVFSYFVLVLSLFSKEFILLLTNEGYSSAVLIIPIISSGYFFYGLFYSGIVGITIFKKTYFQTIAMGVGALVCVLLTYLLTPTYGIIGAAIALAVSFAVLAFLGIYFSQRIYSFGIEVNRLLKVIIVFSLIMLLNLYGGLHDVSLSMILLKLFILVALYPLFLYLFNFFTQEEVTIIFSRIRNIRLNRRRRSNSQ
ncbi:MAG: polysaccharide biosynthesis C-terminal domain-containing protein, partial [Bacteroidetes bacterium]|nr:polysaccharide biosynthesis C-terminal domain-containing protein [Bacteroidota bacterium]